MAQRVACSHAAGVVIHQRVDYGMRRVGALSATRGGLRPRSWAPWFTGGWITGRVAWECVFVPGVAYTCIAGLRGSPVGGLRDTSRGRAAFVLGVDVCSVDYTW